MQQVARYGFYIIMAHTSQTLCDNKPSKIDDKYF